MFQWELYLLLYVQLPSYGAELKVDGEWFNCTAVFKTKCRIKIIENCNNWTGVLEGPCNGLLKVEDTGDEMLLGSSPTHVSGCHPLYQSVSRPGCCFVPVVTQFTPIVASDVLWRKPNKYPNMLEVKAARGHVCQSCWMAEGDYLRSACEW